MKVTVLLHSVSSVSYTHLEHTFYIQIHNLIKGFLRILGKGSAFGYTGIVHQNINATVF